MQPPCTVRGPPPPRAVGCWQPSACTKHLGDPPGCWGPPHPHPRPLSCRSRSPTRTRRRCSWPRHPAPPASSASRRAPPRPEGPGGGTHPLSCAPAGVTDQPPPPCVSWAGGSCAPPTLHPGVPRARGCRAGVVLGCTRLPPCACGAWSPLPHWAPQPYLLLPPQFQVPLAVIKLAVRRALAVPTLGAAGSALAPPAGRGYPSPPDPPSTQNQVEAPAELSL